ncbi:TerB family tellurite resistance protein [Skermanella stibiiresistens]|nr:TerB family tellurite resistance protein [Skermanella stibiiresistens]
MDDGDAGQRAGRRSRDEVQLAAATLLVEAARMDDEIGGPERKRILSLLEGRFSLTETEAVDLLEAAETVSDGPAQWHRFTSTLKDRFSDEERIQMIEMLWEVVYADGELHDLEASLLRRVGGLLYVSDRDRGAARMRVLDRLGISDSTIEAPTGDTSI